MENCIRVYVNVDIHSFLRRCIAFNEAFKARVFNRCPEVKMHVWTDGYSLKIHTPSLSQIPLLLRPWRLVLTIGPQHALIFLMS